jgi:TolA-binding protein
MIREDQTARAAHAERTWIDQMRSERAARELRDRVLARVAAGSAGAATGAAHTSAQALLTTLGIMCALGLSGRFLARSMSTGGTGGHDTPTARTAPTDRQLPTEVSRDIARAHAVEPRAVATPTTPQSAAPRSRLATDTEDGAPQPGLAEELRMLDEARATLARGDLAGADAALARHRQRFPRPVLGEERQALVVELTFRRGDYAGARRQLEVLRRQSPHSPQLARLERTMGISGQPAASPK